MSLVFDLSGIWKFKVDPNSIGESEKWFEGFESNTDIAVPGSWNEMLEEEKWNAISNDSMLDE